jgi:serine/threonine protein kinase
VRLWALVEEKGTLKLLVLAYGARGGRGPYEVSSSFPPPSAPTTDVLVGRVLNGKYKVRSLIAVGGMGKVYRAEQMPLGRDVALKVLHVEGAASQDDPQFQKRFSREASILARLQHPNIVTVFDYGQIEGEPTAKFFISMEYLDGETLGRRIDTLGGMTADETVRVARPIARGLTEAHAQGVIHRDLKPSNVILVPARDGEDIVKIVDFGIVKIIGDDTNSEELTKDGAFIGSPKYMAPEQIDDGGEIDARSDIYAFGIILYQCLSGTVPFHGATSLQTLMAHLHTKPMPLRERVPNVEIPEWLEELVMACIEKDPAKRPQTMDIVARALGAVEPSVVSGRRIPAGEAPPSSPQRASSRISVGATPSGGSTTEGTISVIRRPSDTNPSQSGSLARVEKKPPWAIAAVMFGSMALGAIAIFFGVRDRPGASSTATTQSASVSAPVASHFTLTLESTPPGADVREGNALLGRTPLDVAIDDGVVRAAPRSFVLSKDGFAPFTVVQGPSDVSVKIVTPLVPTPPVASSAAAVDAAPPASASHRAGAPAGRPPPTATGTHPDLDIRMTR